MDNIVDVTMKVDDDLYAQTEALFHESGLSFEEAVLLFVREVARLERLPFDLTEEDFEIMRKLEAAETEAASTDVRYSSGEVLEAMESEIGRSK